MPKNTLIPNVGKKEKQKKPQPQGCHTPSLDPDIMAMEVTVVMTMIKKRMKRKKRMMRKILRNQNVAM